MYVTPKAVSICWINGSWLSSSSGRVASSFVLRQHLVAERAALHIECDGKMVWMFGIDHCESMVANPQTALVARPDDVLKFYG